MIKKTLFVLALPVLAIFLIGAYSKEPMENIEFKSPEEEMFKTVAPDGTWGKPFYLYSRTGIPYRCYIQFTNGQPLACRRTPEGDETLEALKEKESQL